MDPITRRAQFRVEISHNRRLSADHDLRLHPDGAPNSTQFNNARAYPMSTVDLLEDRIRPTRRRQPRVDPGHIKSLLIPNATPIIYTNSITVFLS